MGPWNNHLEINLTADLEKTALKRWNINCTMLKWMNFSLVVSRSVWLQSPFGDVLMRLPGPCPVVCSSERPWRRTCHVVSGVLCLWMSSFKEVIKVAHICLSWSMTNWSELGHVCPNKILLLLFPKWCRETREEDFLDGGLLLTDALSRYAAVQYVFFKVKLNPKRITCPCKLRSKDVFYRLYHTGRDPS